MHSVHIHTGWRHRRGKTKGLNNEQNTFHNATQQPMRQVELLTTPNESAFVTDGIALSVALHYKVATIRPLRTYITYVMGGVRSRPKSLQYLHEARQRNPSCISTWGPSKKRLSGLARQKKKTLYHGNDPSLPYWCRLPNSLHGDIHYTENKIQPVTVQYRRCQKRNFADSIKKIEKSVKVKPTCAQKRTHTCCKFVAASCILPQQPRPACA